MKRVEVAESTPGPGRIRMPDDITRTRVLEQSGGWRQAKRQPLDLGTWLEFGEEARG